MVGARPVNLRALVPAVLCAAAIVVGSPYLGHLRAALQAASPEHYRSIVAAIVAVAVVLVVLAAVLRIRDRRAVRYLCLAAAIAIAFGYASAIRTGDLDRDLVEQFHFVEYGALTLLFYLSWRRRRDITSLVFPVCAAALTGIADEWFQWFVPSRVGEMRDVLLNGVAIGCGLLAAVALAPAAGLRFPSSGRSRAVLAVPISAVVLAGALFLHVVHLGYEIQDADTGTFRSRFSRDTLIALAASRTGEWQTHPPPAAPPLISREDHYLSEGLFHVQERNEAHGVNDIWMAWKENLILERFYAPVLVFASPGSRWTPEQRAAAEVAAADTKPYVSNAYPFPIYTVTPMLFWAVVAGLVAIVWAVV